MKLPIIIWIVYRESDSRNFAAFYTHEDATEYIRLLEQAFPNDEKDYYIDEITLFDDVPQPNK